MAPLNPSDTPRVRVRYQVAGAEHSLIVRHLGTVSAAAVGEAVDALFTATAAQMFQVTILGADAAPAGSDIFNPVELGIEGNVYGTEPGTRLNMPMFASFTGRDSNGHKTRITLFGWAIGDPSYRVTPAENAVVTNVLGVLEDNPGIFISIGGGDPVWHPYANVGLSRHWVQQARRG